MTTLLEPAKEPVKVYEISVGNVGGAFSSVYSANPEIMVRLAQSFLTDAEKKGLTATCRHRGKEIPIEKMKELLGMDQQK